MADQVKKGTLNQKLTAIDISRGAFRNKDAETIQRLQTENKVLRKRYGRKKGSTSSGATLTGLQQLGSKPTLPM